MGETRYINITDPVVKKNCVETVSQIIITNFLAASRPVLVAVGGPGGTGKSTFCLALLNKLPDASILSLDDYRISRKQRQGRTLYGSHPDANRIDLLLSHCEKLKDNVPIQKPVYDLVTGEAEATATFIPKSFVVLDGEIATYQLLRSTVDFSIFIDSDLKTQFASRMNRDVLQRGYSYEKVESVFIQSNIKDFAQFGAESRSWVDVRLFCNNDYSLQIDAVSEEVFARCRNVLT